MNGGKRILNLKSVKYTALVMIMVAMSLTLYVSQVSALSELDFQIVGNRYGVSAHLLRAVSIIESQDGKLTGNYEVRLVVDSTQLKFLKKIARATRRPLSDFKGSYAGAIGYMQIMPSTFYKYAQDGDGDGVKDPLNEYDSLATAAYFLARKIAKHGTRMAIKNYNNSTIYCQKVLQLYWRLELEARIASRQIE